MKYKNLSQIDKYIPVEDNGWKERIHEIRLLCKNGDFNGLDELIDPSSCVRTKTFGLSVSLIKNSKGTAKCFCATLMKNKSLRNIASIIDSSLWEDNDNSEYDELLHNKIILVKSN